MNNNPQNPLVTLTLPWPDEKGTHTAEVPVAERDQYLAEVNKFRQAYRKAYVATDLKKLLRDDLHWWKHLLQDLLPVVFEELRFPPPGDPPAPRLKHDHTEAYLDSWLGGREYLISSQNEILAMREVLRQVASMARGMIFPQDSTFPYGQPAQLLACALVFAAWDRWIESRPLKAPDAFLAGEGTTGFVHIAVPI